MYRFYRFIYIRHHTEHIFFVNAQMLSSVVVPQILLERFGSKVKIKCALLVI